MRIEFLVIAYLLCGVLCMMKYIPKQAKRVVVSIWRGFVGLCFLVFCVVGWLPISFTAFVTVLASAVCSAMKKSK